MYDIPQHIVVKDYALAPQTKQGDHTEETINIPY
jgi:hypothetical protein